MHLNEHLYLWQKQNFGNTSANKRARSEFDEVSMIVAEEWERSLVFIAQITILCGKLWQYWTHVIDHHVTGTVWKGEGIRKQCEIVLICKQKPITVH